VTSLTVNRLGEREVAAIIGHLVGNKQLVADVMAEIVERTDGATEPSARIDVSGRSSANRR
jgi:predicted ATPase